MGDLIDLALERRSRLLARALQRLEEQLAGPVPPPEQFGWMPVGHDPEGRPVRWFLPRWEAQIGYVPGDPDRVFLDARHELRAFSGLTIEDLALALETGTLPTPDLVLDWKGDPVEERPT